MNVMIYISRLTQTLLMLHLPKKSYGMELHRAAALDFHSANARAASVPLEIKFEVARER
jgi:hypothetical protein